jgi:hypothetical protein
MKCYYADHDGTANSVRCAGPVVFTAHDRRGCRDVCFSHAQWLMDGRSMAYGHGQTCSKQFDPTR